MEAQKKIEDFTDLELAEISSNVNAELMRAQQTLLIVNQEITRRKSLINQKKEG